MQLVIISDNKIFPGEADVLNQLFDAGMPLFHLRKYENSKTEIIELLEQVKPEHYSKIAIHQYHEKAGEFDFKRIHFSETDRLQQTEKQLQRLEEEGFILSTSVHSVEVYKGLSNVFEYAFLGPVFDSISKFGYKARKFDLKEKNPNVKVIALGGITADNYKDAITMGFDGVGVLGSIWNSGNQVEALKKIAQIFRVSDFGSAQSPEIIIEEK
ncbi:MAG: thiamine phosphate synthase [Bacteroidota bacterium]|nr:thiamine phosphate synthase [Bacteroidota bacterium]